MLSHRPSTARPSGSALPLELTPLRDTYFIFDDPSKLPVQPSAVGPPCLITGVLIHSAYMTYLHHVAVTAPPSANAFVRGLAFEDLLDPENKYSFPVQYFVITTREWERGQSIPHPP